MELRRLINANFDIHAKFLTLTHKENITDVDMANRNFRKFIQRLRHKYGDFKYAAVIEFQARGAVHYHMIADLPYITKSELAEIWGHGFVRINDIKDKNGGSGVDNVGAYVTAYMTKDQSDPRLHGRKMYFTSKNLIRSRTYRSWEALEIIESNQLEQKKEVFTSSYESEYQGNITYKEYNPKRLPKTEE